MFVVTQKQDLENTRFHSSLPPWLVAVVAEEFAALHQALSPDVEVDRFSLETHGPIAVLEKAESDLAPLGLPYTLLESWPEFVEKIILDSHCSCYRIGILLDNDYMLLLYVQAIGLSEDLQTWLDEQAEDVEVGPDGAYPPSPF